MRRPLSAGLILLALPGCLWVSDAEHRARLLDLRTEPPDTPDTDCDGTWPPCTVSPQELVPVIEAPGAGTFHVAEGAMLEIVDDVLFLWPKQAIDFDRTDRAQAQEVRPDGNLDGPVAFSDGWVAVGLGPDPGTVWWRKLAGFEASGTVEPLSDRARSFGTSVAWQDEGLLATLESPTPGRVAVVRVDLNAELDTSGEHVIAGGATSLVAGGVQGARLLVATQPGTPRGTAFIVADDPRDDIRLSGPGLGQGAVAIADVDGDGEPDVIASSSDTLWVWRGPFDRDAETSDAWWELPLDAPARGIAVTDLGRDGRPDLIVAVAGSAGEVRIYLDADARPSQPSTTIGPGGPRFGASIGVASVSIDGQSTDVILVGDPGRQRVDALPWPD